MNSKQTLAELIKSIQEREGWSDRDLGKRAEKLKLDITTSNFSRLKNREIVSVKGSVIRMVAQVLKVSEEKVARAALMSMGLDFPTSEVSIKDAVRNSSELSIRDQKLVLGLVDAMLDSGSGSNSGNQRPNEPSPSTPHRRAVESDSDHSGTEQKTSVEDPVVKKLHAWDADVDTTPPAADKLAALAKFKTHREKFDDTYGERGEENQDPDSE